MDTIQYLASAEPTQHICSYSDFFEEDYRTQYIDEPAEYLFGSNSMLQGSVLSKGLGYASGSHALPDAGPYYYVHPRPVATKKVLLDGQIVRLLSTLVLEIQRKQAHLDGASSHNIVAAAFGLLSAAQHWQPETLSLELTYDPSLVLRVSLGDKGTLHLSMTLGHDSDPEEDTFATWRSMGKELWGMSGSFKTVLSQVFHKGAVYPLHLASPQASAAK